MTTKARMSERVLPVQAGQDRALTLEIARWPSLRDRFPLPAGEGQGEGESGLQLSGTWGFAWRGALFCFAQSSGVDRQFADTLVCGAFLPPHPRPLPEERENRTMRCRQSGAPRLFAARDTVFPEGRVRESGAKYEIVFRQCFQGFPLSPALSPLVPRGEREKPKRRLLPVPSPPILWISLLNREGRPISSIRKLPKLSGLCTLEENCRIEGIFGTSTPANQRTRFLRPGFFHSWGDLRSNARRNVNQKAVRT